MVDPNKQNSADNVRNKVAQALARILSPRDEVVAAPELPTPAATETAAPPFWYLDGQSRQDTLNAHVEVAADQQLSQPDPLAAHEVEFKPDQPR